MKQRFIFMDIEFTMWVPFVINSGWGNVDICNIIYLFIFIVPKFLKKKNNLPNEFHLYLYLNLGFMALSIACFFFFQFFLLKKLTWFLMWRSISILRYSFIYFILFVVIILRYSLFIYVYSCGEAILTAINQ